MTKRKKNWSKIVDEHGIQVRLYTRSASSNIYREIRLSDGSKDRKSLGHGDRERAEKEAKALCEELALTRITGRDIPTLTMGQLFAAYFDEQRGKAPTLSEQRRGYAETCRDLFEECWGRDLEVANVSQTHVDRYASGRRSGELSPLGDGGQGDREPFGVRDGTIDSNFRWLSSVFNWARRHKRDGKRLLSENPLHDLEWPKEKEENKLRPVASHQRFVATMKHVDDVDPTGRLRAILALARWTGRRESAICGLRASDVLRSQETIRAALADAGMDERIAQYMPHGAIRWPADTDKMGIRHITPISEDAREELDRYRKKNPRLGDVPLFPGSRKPRKRAGGKPPKGDPRKKPIRRDVVANWLLRAEKKAGLPKLRGGTFHPYRRLWATERKHLPDADVAAAGGWTDVETMQLSYQHADPETVLKVVEGGA